MRSARVKSSPLPTPFTGEAIMKYTQRHGSDPGVCASGAYGRHTDASGSETKVKFASDRYARRSRNVIFTRSSDVTAPPPPRPPYNTEPPDRHPRVVGEPDKNVR
ncbi:unnamed protein product, partial [Iphiclides podalirius]